MSKDYRGHLEGAPFGQFGNHLNIKIMVIKQIMVISKNTIGIHESIRI